MNLKQIYKPCMLLLLGMALWSACSSPRQVVYFQDLRPGETEIAMSAASEIRLRPEDKVSIIVNSRDPQLTNLFNLPYVSKQLGAVSGSSGSNQGVSGYTVDDQGEIDFPVLGKLYIAGMKRQEVAEFIKNKLIAANLVKDPIVTVEFQNLCISVLGEVNNPGRYAIDRDNMTLLDVLSQAGDLTIQGERQHVYVLRTQGNKQTSYEVNLCSLDDLQASPAYYVQQGDVVVGMAGGEHWPGLCVETDYLLAHQIGYRPGVIQTGLVDYTYLPRESPQRHLLYLFWKYANFEHIGRLSI